MKESKFYEKLGNQQVKCGLCNHHCQLSIGGVGICGIRQNIGGKLYSLNYGRLITEAVDPVEKKPLFHFLPGTLTYSIATIGCNFHCDNCHNWQISQESKKTRKQENKLLLPGYDVTAEEIVKRAIESDCRSISYTYTEPTIFAEFAIDCMRQAKKKGLKNSWVSNGYMSKKCLEAILPYLDAINVDLKFFDDNLYVKNCGARLQPVLDNLKFLAKRKNVDLEITTLLIPGLTDLDNQPLKIAEFIAKELSVDIPWHISRFSPEISYKMQNGKTTPDKLIDEVYKIGKKAGLKYVYVGNVWGDERENTYCPKCQQPVIKRLGYEIQRFDKNGCCAHCHYQLPLKIN